MTPQSLRQMVDWMHERAQKQSPEVFVQSLRPIANEISETKQMLCALLGALPKDIILPSEVMVWWERESQEARQSKQVTT